jgi:hypothetical protein
MMRVSGKLRPHAFTVTNTSLALGFRFSTSSKTKEDGGPYALHRIALIDFIVIIGCSLMVLKSTASFLKIRKAANDPTGHTYF